VLTFKCALFFGLEIFVKNVEKALSERVEIANFRNLKQSNVLIFHEESNKNMHLSLRCSFKY